MPPNCKKVCELDIEIMTEETSEIYVGLLFIEAIMREAQELFDDVVEDFGTVEGILARFQEWKKQDHETYKESYAYMCVPKCLGPLIRLQLLSWDPFEVSYLCFGSSIL